MPRSEERGGMAARSEAEINSIVVYKSPARQGRVLYSVLHIGEGAISRAGIHCMNPFGYLDFMALVANSRIVLTDSGGLQEETTVLGIPCLTLRENTERPVTVTHGTNRFVGISPARITAEVSRVLGAPLPRTVPPHCGMDKPRSELWLSYQSAPQAMVALQDWRKLPLCGSTT